MSPKTIVTSILEPDPESFERRFADVPAGSALVEIRADRLRREEVAGLVRRAPRPAIVTVRASRDGGSFEGSEEERRRILEDALAAGAAYVDVEWGSSLASFARGARAAKTILSHHGGPCTASALDRVFRAMRASGAGRLKIVPRAEAAGDGVALRALLARAAAEGAVLAAFATGRAGLLTRILAPAWGSWGTYGSVAAGAETGEGQPPAADLVGLWDVLAIGPETRLFALVGDPVLESPSPAMHARGHRGIGLDARFVPVETSSFADALAACGPAGFAPAAALAVTMPHKERAAADFTSGDSWVRASGSANTVVFEPGRSVAYNTDAPAALGLIRRAIDPSGRAVAIVGAGGTARALAVALRDAGARVTLFNRTAARAEAAAGALGIAWAPLAEIAKASPDILINATPLGRRGEAIVLGRAASAPVVLDVAYASETTPLVDEARERNAVVFDGLQMLAAQAALQFERMTGRSIAASILLDEARRTARSKRGGRVDGPAGPP